MPIQCRQNFLPSVFSGCGLEALFPALQELRIITDYRFSASEDTVQTTFTCYDRELADYLSGYADANVSDRVVLFTPAEGLREYPLSGRIPLSGTDPERMKDFLRDLYRMGYLTDLPHTAAEEVHVRFRDVQYLSLFRKEGTAFEYLVYHELRSTGLFDDVEIGFSFQWNAQSADPVSGIRAQMADRCGYAAYLQARRQAQNAPGMSEDCKNEIDVTATKGLTTCFISCKAGVKVKDEWLYEISYLSGRFGCRPVLVVSHNLSQKQNVAFIRRAEQMGVTLLGIETLLDPEKLRTAVQSLLNEEVQEV